MSAILSSHAESNNIILYGFSFYTASIAYLLHSRHLSAKSIAVVSNPLLLITGPIATCFRSIRHYSFKRRFKYFFPYILVGLFLHQTIATPLTKAFHLIALTDVISTCVFAVDLRIIRLRQLLRPLTGDIRLLRDNRCQGPA